MNDNEFLDRLVHEVETAKPDEHSMEAKRVIAMSVGALNRILGGTSLMAELQIGHAVNYGLQHNVIVRQKERGRFRDVLFRAYIPFDGYPVQLDLLGEELEEHGDRESLQQAIIEFFKNPDVILRIQQYKEMKEETYL